MNSFSLHTDKSLSLQTLKYIVICVIHAVRVCIECWVLRFVDTFLSWSFLFEFFNKNIDKRLIDITNWRGISENENQIIMATTIKWKVKEKNVPTDILWYFNWNDSKLSSGFLYIRNEEGKEKKKIGIDWRTLIRFRIKVFCFFFCCCVTNFIVNRKFSRQNNFREWSEWAEMWAIDFHLKIYMVTMSPTQNLLKS